MKEGKHVARRETNPVQKRLQDLKTLRITTQRPLAKSVFSCVCISRPVADPREIALSQTSKSEFWLCLPSTPELAKSICIWHPRTTRRQWSLGCTCVAALHLGFRCFALHSNEANEATTLEAGDLDDPLEFETWFVQASRCVRWCSAIKRYINSIWKIVLMLDVDAGFWWK